MAAIDTLNDADGYNFGARRFTISTVGLVPQIKRFADEKRQVNLAISLHAADDAERLEIMPVNKRYKIDDVIQACRYYVDRHIAALHLNGLNQRRERYSRSGGKLVKGLKGCCVASMRFSTPLKAIMAKRQTVNG
jgi:adenine C2-methylase RlmN of 23S rRNA A2503 and tRNA A37